MTKFIWPEVFFALPLPLLFYLLLPEARSSSGKALRIPFFKELAEFGDTTGKKSSSWLKIIAIISWILLVTAGARPQWIGEPLSTPISGRDLLLAVDISGNYASFSSIGPTFDGRIKPAVMALGAGTTIAYGVSEQKSSSTDGYEVTVGKIEHYSNLTSKWGIEQATGNEWIWGKDVGGNRDEGETSWEWHDKAGGRGQIYALHDNQNC
jgi:hypothetical protein